MISSFFRSKKARSTLLITIGSATIGAAFTRSAQDGSEEVVWSKRAPFSLGEEKGVNHQFKNLSRTLRDVLKDARKKAHELGSKQISQRPDKIVVVFGAPWYAAKVERIDQPFKETSEVTAGYVDSITTHAQKAFQKIAPGNFPELLKEDTLVALQGAYLETRLNGYPVDDPIGNTADSFACSLLLSAIPSTLDDIVSKAVDEQYNINSLVYVTEPFIFSVALDKVFQTVKNTVFLTVSGEQTNILVVSEGVLKTIYSFDVGENDIVRRVSKRLGVGEETARSLLSLSREKNVIEEERVKLQEAADDIVSVWVSDFQKIRKQMMREEHWSNSAVILARGDMAAYFHDALRDVTDDKMNIIELDRDYMNSNVRFRPNLTFDPLLAVAAAANSQISV